MFKDTGDLSSWKPHIIYYVASSLDGYIATSDGKVDWLSDYEMEGEDYGYKKFYDLVDALLMGSRTYEQIMTFGDWPYPDKPCWVFSRRQLPIDRPETILTSQSPEGIVFDLQERNLKLIWLVGGEKLATSFRKKGLIDEYIITVMPIILGSGIPLFGTSEAGERLELAESKPYRNGCVQLHYFSKLT